MAVVKTGIFFENASTYTYGFSDASGQLLVSNGQTLTLTSATAGPFVSAGSPGSGTPDPDALGAIILRDQGSLLQVVSGPASPDGTGLSIGYGARGLMQVLGGAEFRLSNPTGANNAEVSIGVGGGIGAALVDASEITIQSMQGEVGLMIGDWAGSGADGTLSLRNGATALFEGGAGVFANVGRLAGNEGAIFVESGSALELRAPDGRQANLRVGRNEGTGQLQVTGENSLVQLSGQLAIGLDGGLGAVQIANGGAVVNAHNAFAATRIGHGTDAQGAATVDSGSLTTRSETGFAQLDIGVAGGKGTLQGTGSALTVQGMQGVDVAIGAGAGANGWMRLENGSTAQFSSGNGGVNLDVGRSGASGLLEVIGSQMTIHAPSDGGTASYAFVLVGSQGGEGQLILDASQLSIEGQSAGVHVGTRWSGSDANDGTGDMILRNGSELHVQAGDVTGGFWVGGGEGSQGRAQILSGSVLDMGGNGLVQIGFAAPNMTGGGTGHVTIDGAGSQMTGLRGLDLGRGGSDGVLDVSNDARALFGGLGAGRNVNLDIGWDTGSTGALNITDALVSVQAGTAEDEPFEFKGVTANFGRQGGTGLANISGAGHDEGEALQGLVLFGHANSDYVDMTFGQGVGSAGHAVVRGAVLGGRNDGITFGPEGEVNLGGDGGYAAMRIGLQGGAGSVDLGESSTLFVISGGVDDAAEIVVGSGAGAVGSLHLSGESELDLISRQQDAWLVAGGEGGASGTITISASSAYIEAARNGGVRLGTSWFDTPDQVGIGRLTLEEGSDLTISAQGSGANFFVGGGAGSDAQALIRDSSVTMEGDAHRLVLVGGTPAFTPGTGGKGEMHLQGATARLLGARDILVGTNGGDGRLELRAGAQAILEDAGGGNAGQTVAGVGIGRVREGQPDIAATGALVVDGAATLLAGNAADVARLIVGASGGTAAAQISGGASALFKAGISTVEIGVDGGIGRMDVTGAGTRVAVEGADGRIHIGRGLNPQASADGAGKGILTIGAGADVLASTKVELGDGSASVAVLALAGGRLTTPLIEVYSGPAQLNNMLLGYGEIIGTAGQPALVMSGSSFYVGDQIGADGGQITATGVMEITGNVVKQGSAVHFDIGSVGGGYDQVVVTGAFAMNGGSLHLSMLDAAQNALAGNGLRLLSASDGIFLNDVALMIDPLPDGTVIGTELRAGDTELWAVWEGGPAAFVPLPAAWQSWLDWIGGGGGAPPAAPPVARADTIADPHLVTLDGLAYDFHAAGEFVLTRSTDGSFEVQARMAPVGENASENVAAAVRLDGGTVMVDATTPDSVLINGNAVTLASGQSVAVGGDLVYRTGNTWHLVHRHGAAEGDTLSAVSATVIEGRLDISVFLSPVLSGQVNGLLGNFDGNPDTDLALPDGQLVSRPLVFGDDPEAGILGLYGAFRDAWRVSDRADSLFTYSAGEGPDSFYLSDYPSGMTTLADFDADAIESATQTLVAAGLEQGSVAFNNALFDLLVTENPAYVAAAVTFQTQQQARPETAPEIIAPPVTGGALEGLVTFGGQVLDVRGAAMEGVRVTFTPQGQSVAHIRNSRSEGEFGFDLLPNQAGGVVDATRPYDPSVDGTVTALDALDVLRMAVGLRPSFGDAPGEAFIAADINRDGQITALDALEVLRAAVGLPSENAPRWVFIDAAADLSELDRSGVNIPSGVRLDTLDAGGAEIGLTAILLGNMQEFA